MVVLIWYFFSLIMFLSIPKMNDRIYLFSLWLSSLNLRSPIIRFSFNLQHSTRFYFYLNKCVSMFMDIAFNINNVLCMMVIFTLFILSVHEYLIFFHFLMYESFQSINQSIVSFSVMFLPRNFKILDTNLNKVFYIYFSSSFMFAY